jgi:putative membrane protein
MNLAASIVTGVVALLHTWFLILEMFLWKKPLGLKTFGMDAARAETTAVLAANQGLYNGFLVAGLVWALVHPDPAVGVQLARFFLGCVIVAGLYGAYSVSPRIMIIQGVPAIIALALTFL